MVVLNKENTLDVIEMRQAYCDTLIEIASNNPRIVSVNCDLCSSMGLTKFATTYPDRSFNVGLMESNGLGISAGISAAGYIPFFHTFAIFATRRVFDQAFISCAYAGLNVKIIGGDAGVSATYNGGTHMAFEDVGIMRSIPKITIIEPSDTVMMKVLTKKISEIYGVFYVRFPRKQTIRIYEPGSDFKIGKAVVLREGKDVTLLGSGLTVSECLKAADMLAGDGISARVVDVFTIKPIDKECVVESAELTGAIVAAENHSIYNGLGSAVSEVLSESMPVPMERVGVQDEFGEVGVQEHLMERFKLTASTICEKAKKAISRKKA